jgi:hypothetical protein
MNERFEELVSGIVVPLVLGGKLQLTRPFGSTALTVGQDQRITDPDVRSRLDIARVRRARLIAPIDVLPELEASDWAIAALLNDLLQATNHNLGGVFTKGRYDRLMHSVLAGCQLVAAPQNVGEALSRHATFAKVMELFRTDTSVHWWTGSARFRGSEPPERLLAWRGVRRVQVDTDRVPVARMADNLTLANGFLDALSAWLHLSPLTDLATMTRESPAFVWSAPTIGLIAVPPGRTLAFRLLSRAKKDAVTAMLKHSTTTIPQQLEPQRAMVDEFVREMADALRLDRTA